MDNIKRIRRISCFIVVAVIIAAAALILRGPHISNSLKKIILPELEKITGQKVITQKIYVNIFPLFIEAKDMKVFDEEGEKVLFATRVKAYVDLSGIFNKRLIIRRLVIKDPEFTGGNERIEEIIGHVRKYIEEISDLPLKVTIRAVEVRDGHLQYSYDKQDVNAEIRDLNSEMVFGNVPRIKFSAPDIKISKKDLQEITGESEATLVIRDKTILIEKFRIGTLGSKMTGSGEYKNDSLSLKANTELLVSTVKKIFGLKQFEKGMINAEGNIQYAGKVISLDLKLEGNLYLETLMELLKVKDRVEGFVDVKGELKGPLNNLKGKARATMHNGNLYNVDIDTLKCNISYADGVMSFTEGDGRVYNGHAKASAAIELPVVKTFALNIDFTDADSIPIFRLIGWDPGIQPGKVRGSLRHSGADFNPEGWFEYKSTAPGRNVLGRVSSVSGRYDLRGQELSLRDLKLGTEKSFLTADGIVDIEKETLDFTSSLKSSDLTDIALPYYDKLKGHGEFLGMVQGTFDDPLIRGKIKMLNPVIEDYPADMLEADISYKKNLLNIKELILKEDGALHTVTGSILFNKASELFDLTSPEYRLNAIMKGADLGRFGKIFYSDFKGNGKFQASFKINGLHDNPDIKGDATLEAMSVHGVPFDGASFEMEYAGKKLHFSNMKIRKGKSLFIADAYIKPDDTFSYRASSERILLSDVLQQTIQGDAVFSLQSEGSGTFSNPDIFVSGRILEGTMRGKSIGSGNITASVKNRDISLKADLLNERIRISGHGRLEKEIPWDALVDIQTSRYDFLISSFLKDIPEDFIFNLNGNIRMKGDRNHISASASFKNLVLSMYGYSFTNVDEIKVDLNDKQISINKISLRSGNTFLNIDGGLVIGRKYDLVLDGNSALAPFKSLFPKVGLLKGDAEFKLTVGGEWENPMINGWLTLKNGSFGLKDYPHRISGLNGSLQLDNDRIVLKNLSGKLGGGDIDISGIVYLKKFLFRRFYVEAKVDNITTSVSNDFSVNYSGNILYKGTPDSQIISGDVKIHKAKYRERVEWKSWLLKTKTTERLKTEISNLDKAELNIRIFGKETISVDNNVARAIMSADMVLRGTIYRPVLFGRLESKEGTVYFRNNVFRILHASADFADPHRINPVMDISAETLVKSYKIKMNLEGQMEHFNMSLSSDPPLKEIDILSLLTVGQTGGELKGLEGGIGASEATSFVTGKLQDVIEERLKTVTGLDRLQIDPHVSKTTGTVEPRVTVSKRLLGEKMFVTYTTALGSKEEQVVKLEYFLNKNTSLIGERDERGIMGGDIKFRFEFR